MKSCRAPHGPGQIPRLCITFRGSERTQDHFQVGDKPGGQHVRVSFETPVGQVPSPQTALGSPTILLFSKPE